MATFGRTADGSGVVNFLSATALVSKATPASSGILTAIKVRMKMTTAGTLGAKAVIYADSAGSPGSLIGISDEVTISGTTEAEYSFTMPDISITGGTDYWIGVIGNKATSTYMAVSRETTITDARKSKNITYPTAPDPFGTLTSGTGQIDCYGVYTENSSPTVALNSPADASSGSDTTPTLNFTGTDTDSDAVEYEVQVDTANTFNSQTGTPTEIASYSESNASGAATWPTDGTIIGQTFDSGAGGVLDSIKLYGGKNGSPTGNAVMKIYAVTGTYGSTDVPTGSVLATSDNFDVSGLSGSAALRTFQFSGANKITLSASTKYAFIVEYSGGDGSNNIWFDYDNTSTSYGGRLVYWNGSAWDGDIAYDVCFHVYVENKYPLLDKFSASDAGFTAGHPFASGSAIDYTVQSALSAGTYYWRVRAIDPSGSNTYGAWSSTRSFTITAGGNVRLINIGDDFKTVTSMKINVGDVWKDVVSVKVNVGDDWKTII